MTSKLAQLNALELNLDKFYNISFSQYEIRLQGDYDNILVRRLTGLGYSIEVQAKSGYVYCKLGNVVVVLT